MSEIYYGVVKKIRLKTTENKKAYSCDVELLPDGEELEDIDIMAPMSKFHAYPRVGDRVVIAEVYDYYYVVLGVVYRLDDSNLPSNRKSDSSIIIGDNFIEINEDTTINITLAQGKSLTINVSGGGQIKLGGSSALALASHTHIVSGVTLGDDSVTTGVSSANTTNLKGG